MEEIQVYFGKKASIITEFDRHPSSISGRDIKEEILEILKRRPLSSSDLSKGIGIPQDELKKHIDPLVREGKIQIRIFGSTVYYEMNQCL